MPDVDIDDEAVTADRQWGQVMKPIIDKLDLVDKFGGEACFNQDGSRALKHLVVTMAERLDRKQTLKERWAMKMAEKAVEKAERKAPIRVTIHPNESWQASLIRDAGSFSVIVGLFWVNHNFLGDHWFVYLISTFLGFVFMIGHARKIGLMSDCFQDPNDAIEYIKEKVAERDGEPA